MRAKAEDLVDHAPSTAARQAVSEAVEAFRRAEVQASAAGAVPPARRPRRRPTAELAAAVERLWAASTPPPGPPASGRAPTLRAWPRSSNRSRLARVVDFAERSRVGDWSLRSALVRYAEGQPERVSAVLEQVRRLDAALHPFHKVLEKRGTDLWRGLDGGDAPEDALLLELLRVAVDLDGLGDVLAVWADDRSRPRPDDTVDATPPPPPQRLDDLGVAREEQPPRRSGRGG